MINPRTGRIDGAWMMKQIYDDLGVYRDLGWHMGSRNSNVAHNWNDGESWDNIWRKLLDGSGEWDRELRQAINTGELSRSTIASAQKHYNTFNINDTKITSAEHVIKRDREADLDYAQDYWKGKVEELTVPGREGLDLSPSDSALNTWYATERIDQGLNEDVPGYGTIQGMREVMDNVEAKFLDEVYNSAGEVNEAVQAHWGLDLRRVGLGYDAKTVGQEQGGLVGLFGDLVTGINPSRDWEDVDVRSPEYYEQLTKGDVNWAAYRNDTKYIAAFNEMADKWATDDDDTTDASYWDITKLGEDISQVGDDVAKIRQINKETDVLEKTMQDDGDGWKYNWEGKYDPDKVVYNGNDLWIDGEKQERPSEMYGIDPDTGQPKNRLLDPADYPIEHDPIVGPVTPVVKPDIKIPNVKVKRPANIPASWGAV